MTLLKSLFNLLSASRLSNLTPHSIHYSMEHENQHSARLVLQGLPEVIANEKQQAQTHLREDFGFETRPRDIECRKQLAQTIEAWRKYIPAGAEAFYAIEHDHRKACTDMDLQVYRSNEPKSYCDCKDCTKLAARKYTYTKGGGQRQGLGGREGFCRDAMEPQNV